MTGARLARKNVAVGARDRRRGVERMALVANIKLCDREYVPCTVLLR